MAASAGSLPLQRSRWLRTSWFRPKYLLFGFIALMTAYVLSHNERFLIDAKHPAWQH